MELNRALMRQILERQGIQTDLPLFPVRHGSEQAMMLAAGEFDAALAGRFITKHDKFVMVVGSDDKPELARVYEVELGKSFADVGSVDGIHFKMLPAKVTRLVKQEQAVEPMLATESELSGNGAAEKRPVNIGDVLKLLTEDHRVLQVSVANGMREKANESLATVKDPNGLNF